MQYLSERISRIPLIWSNEVEIESYAVVVDGVVLEVGAVVGAGAGG
jgi:hypothetical protein